MQTEKIEDEGKSRRREGVLRVAAVFAIAALIPFSAAADETEDSNADGDNKTSIERLEEQISVLADEIASLKTSTAVPEEADPTESIHGLGPAASKVYKREGGLSIGGYGDVRFRTFVDESDGKASIYDALRMVLYAGYKYNDWLVFNSEIEFEHADTGNDGSVAVEFMTIDFLLKDYFNIRTGLVLIPMGFINEVHEPPFYFGAERPEVERRIIPSTWRENGAGFFGSFDLGGAGALGYRMYGVNGFDAAGFSSSGLRGGRQKGSKALSDHFAFVGRLDWDMSAFLPGALVGGSVYTGKSGQNQSITRCIDFCDPAAPGEPVPTEESGTFKLPDTFTTIYEVHAQYKAYGFTARGLFAQTFVDEAKALSLALGTSASSSVARGMYGGYAELGYDVMPLLVPETEMSLEPFFRYEHVDTQASVANGFTRNGNKEFDLYVVGISYKPIPQVVIKVDYRNFDARKGSISDEVEASIGFVF